MGYELTGVLCVSRVRRYSDSSPSHKHFRRHVTSKDFYFCTCCMEIHVLHAGTRRAYTSMEYVMHKGLHMSQGATPTSAAVTTLAHFDVLYGMYTRMVDGSRAQYSVEQALRGPTINETRG